MKKNKERLLYGALTLAVLSIPLYILRYDIKEFFGIRRIHSVEETFLTMSPDLRREHERYSRECASHLESCDTKAFFKKRDIVVRRDWPMVYEYLRHYENWGEGYYSRGNRNIFFKDMKGFSPTSVRDRYIPILRYRDGRLVLENCSENIKRHYVSKEIFDAGLCK